MNSNQKRTALLLINLGTPDAPTVRSVGKYLFQFLNDKYVMSIPWLFRKLLVNLIIIPFRVRKSTKLYKQLWTPEGSPLTVHMTNLKKKLQKSVNEKISVFSAMRYQNPSIQSALDEIKKQGFGKLIVLPLYPQFASSTTTSTIEEVKRVIKGWDTAPEIQFIEQYYGHQGFLNAYAERIRFYQPENYDFFLFSYHGLPNSHITKIHKEHEIESCNCENVMPKYGKFCYRAACFHTTRLLASQLGLAPGSYTTSFQSRLSKNWLEPFTDKTLEQLAQKGYKRVLVATPAFVADCLETTIEIGFEYKIMFQTKGGQELTMVESLNSEDSWVNGIIEIVDDCVTKKKQSSLQHEAIYQ